ncbi:DUF799 family lipoprotein [Thalassotalea ponticola]|uniref:GNA1162 family protein n=1 Tax=Thalassotalea ponticola TaxID=1523392 RepID=UPI0025B39A02|nr:GNA1162 family protein [Thalassotalea ponticola]MDN3651317.1 DUF799 family lipoprotein [Thalassotalea ponticola]
MNKLFAVLLLSLVVSGCGTTLTKQEAFPKMYNEKPHSIVVVPAVNNTTASDAANLFSTTIAQPLAEAGYYVVPVPFVSQMLAREGVSDGAQIRNIPASKFKALFGADSVLFVNINQWDTNYYVLAANVTVGLDFELLSTTTNEVLWQYDNVIVQDTSGGNSGNPLIDALVTAVNTAATDYVPIARMVNSRIINTIPVGKYHKRHGADGNDSGIVKAKVQ